MRYTIIPLGGSGRPVGRLVSAIVDYLRPRRDPSGVQATSPHEGVATPERYYADGGEEPGRWRGKGAEANGLTGTVDTEDFAKVLSGRDPHTGERLITAQGSAGRRPRLGAGTHTRHGETGQALYDLKDAAVVLRLPQKQVQRLVLAGVEMSLRRMFSLKTVEQPEVSYLVPYIDAAGNCWLTEGELERYVDATAVGVTVQQIAAMGPPQDTLTLPAAARLVGTTPQYLGRLAKRYEDNQREIDQLQAEGRKPSQQFLVAGRDSKGNWQVTRDELAQFVGRRRQPAVRVGYDLTLTTEKSLSILALLAGPKTCRSVLDAIEAGNDYGIDWLERHSAAARADGEIIPVNGWMVASFRHRTSRALDPFAHHHNVIANSVEDEHGDRRALDARGLYRDAKAASALATAEMRYQLTLDLGVSWRPAQHGGWETAGISDEVIREFSRRRTELEDALRELEEAIGRGCTLEEVDQMVVKTRPGKQHVLVHELLDEWWQRAQAVGLTAEGLQACIAGPRELPEPDLESVFARLAGPDGICTNLSIFDRGDLLAALANIPTIAESRSPQPMIVSASRLERIAAEFLRSGHVIALTDQTDLSPARYTTRDMLGIQSRVVARFRQGLGQGAALAPADTVDDVLATHAVLTDEQAALVRSFATSGHRIQCAIGYPGAGKTTCMAAARDVWQAAGFTVKGAAVKGEAARTLETTAGIPAETLAWYLAHDDPLTAPLDGRTVLIVDEATTISDRDLDRLGWLAEQTGATLRLVGDPAQHGAVEAGGMFRVLCERHPNATPQLTRTHRLQDPHDRAAADHLRRGDVTAALDALHKAGHLHVVEDELQAFTHVLGRWWRAHQAGEEHPMVARRNSVRRGLNRLAHTLLLASGELGDERVEATGARSYATGDRIIARMPCRDLHPPGRPDAYVRNGAIGTITRIYCGNNPDDDLITIRFDDLGSIDLPRHFFDEHAVATDHGVKQEVGIDHAYAVTSYAVTGATHEVSTSRIDETASRAETYVNITRGRQANHLYITRRHDELAGESLPRTPPDPLEETVANKLARSQGERTAWEIYQDQIERADRGLDIGR